ncbi:molybdopterin converting factor subunit 1 [Gallaecimonas mangrovi]|uniref:molybdopterin converting factor subunit 1 n=1 Tax=Gallaecimonas mangrovi TaxID=2291597 RepID=UPI000E20C1F2|nr:molybdopterin converting factor subunit 1 [Gallaecimonas mangrovi]
MTKVLFFGQLREQIGSSELQLPEHFATLGALRNHLMAQFPHCQAMLAPGSALGAVNQTISDDQQALGVGDEIALFPPVTGG